MQIPDLSSYEPDPDRVAQLESLLGRDLPDDIGTITLVQSDRLAAVQDAVRAFDVITVVHPPRHPLRAAGPVRSRHAGCAWSLWLAFGPSSPCCWAAVSCASSSRTCPGALADGGLGRAVLGVIDSSVDSLMWFSFVLIVVALVVAGLAILVERRAGSRRGHWTPATLREWLRARARVIGLVGIGIVAFVVALEHRRTGHHAACGAALVGIILIAVAVIGGRDPAQVRRRPAARHRAGGPPASRPGEPARHRREARGKHAHATEGATRCAAA